MKLQGFVSALVLAAAAVLPGTATATNLQLEDALPSIDRILPGHGNFDLLHPNDWKNRDLESGKYAFLNFHGPHGSGFFDDWRFTLGQDSNVSISLLDLVIPARGGDAYEYKNGGQGDLPLFDSKYLTVSLFNGTGQLLGSTGENGILEVTNLLAGEWYTIAVSGKVNGLIGSGYFGSLVATEVPLGDSLPLFGSALLVLAIRGRKWLNRQPATT